MNKGDKLQANSNLDGLVHTRLWWRLQRYSRLFWFSLTPFLHPSSCYPHGRNKQEGGGGRGCRGDKWWQGKKENKEMPAFEMPAQLSTQRRTTETVMGAMLSGKTVFPPFSKLRSCQILYLCAGPHLFLLKSEQIPMFWFLWNHHKLVLCRRLCPSGRAAMQHMLLFSLGLKNRLFPFKIISMYQRKQNHVKPLGKKFGTVSRFLKKLIILDPGVLL